MYFVAGDRILTGRFYWNFNKIDQISNPTNINLVKVTKLDWEIIKNSIISTHSTLLHTKSYYIWPEINQNFNIFLQKYCVQSYFATLFKVIWWNFTKNYQKLSSFVS